MSPENHAALLAQAEKSAFEYAEISTDLIRFSEEVVNACRANYCGRYGTCWTCPPAVGSLESLRAKYTAFPRALVFTTRHGVEDSFDIEGMFEARLEHERAEAEILGVLRGEKPAVLGAGGCSFCKKCTYPDAPCRFPERAKPSVEACGIDVVQLAAACGIRYHNGENTVTYFSAIFF